MPDHSELQRLARQFMDETGDKEPQNVEHGREQVFLCESKGREAGHNKVSINSHDLRRSVVKWNQS